MYSIADDCYAYGNVTHDHYACANVILLNIYALKKQKMICKSYAANALVTFRSLAHWSHCPTVTLLVRFFWSTKTYHHACAYS